MMEILGKNWKYSQYKIKHMNKDIVESNKLSEYKEWWKKT
jgi:hypothetical protein